MSTSSQKLNRLCKRILTALAIPAVVAMFGTASGFAGAIFTSDLNCDKVNGNIYTAKTDVWLSGGPDGTGSALEPNTNYCVRVYEPDGTTLLSTQDCIKTTDDTGHFACFNLYACTLFKDTTNPGGEYKVRVCGPITDTLDCDAAQANPQKYCKDDNFKVRNSATCTSLPCISCPLDIEVPCTQVNGGCAVVQYADPIVIDDGAGFVCDHPSGSCFPVGTTLVTCTVNATTTSCSFNVKVGACPQCTLTCPDAITTCNAPGKCGTNVDWLLPSCPETDVTVTCDHQPKDVYPVGTTTVKCTATQTGVTDPVAQCSFDITVNDCEAPTFTCPTGGYLGCNPKTLPTCVSLKALVLLSATDNCPGTPTVNCDSSDSTVDCLVTRKFTISASDGINTSAPCYVTNTWTVDTDPPAITCPGTKNVQCETFTPVTTATSITVDAFKTLGGTISDNCPGSLTLSYKDTGPVGDCPKVYTRTYTAVDACNNTNTCKQTINCFCASLVTDTARCTLLQPCDSGPGFRLIFTQDPLNLSCYKLTASNPGQFYYNAFHVGSPAEAVTFTVTLTYPFVTQSANPIEVYDSAGFSTANGQTCFTPGTKILPLTNQVTLATYGANPVVGVTTTSFTVTVPAAVNDTGFVWLAVHLDYGLKGQSYGQNTTTLAATQCGGTTVLIPNNQTYNFSVSNGSAGSSSIKSCNTFKKLPGIGGLVCNSVTTRMMSGVPAVLKDSTGKVLATGTTDQDGWYMCTYKWAGKAVTLYVTITPSGSKAQTKSVTLKSNGYAEVDFTCP